MHLLSIVKIIMDPNAPRVRWCVRCKWKRLEGVGLIDELLSTSLLQSSKVVLKKKTLTLHHSEVY